MSTGIVLDIRSLLSRPMSELRGFAHPDGRPMTPRQVQSALLDQLASGRELLPVGSTNSFNFITRT